MTSTIRLLGIDPALRNTGLAFATYNIDTGDLLIEELRLVQTDKSKDIKVVRRASDDLSRARTIVRGLQDAIRDFKPSMAVAEVPTGTQNARGAFSNGICCGVLASVSVPVIEVSPTEVKMASVGSLAASKAQMIAWAHKNWPAATWLKRKVKGEVTLIADNEHMADACAAVVAGTLTVQFSQAVAMMTAMRQQAA